MRFRWKERVCPVEETVLDRSSEFWHLSDQKWIVGGLSYFLDHPKAGEHLINSCNRHWSYRIWFNERWTMEHSPCWTYFYYPKQITFCDSPAGSMFRCRGCIWRPPASPRSSKSTRSQRQFSVPCFLLVGIRLAITWKDYSGKSCALARFELKGRLSMT